MKVQLVITFEDGRIDLSGPLPDKILCLGLLEMAKDIVLNHVEKKVIVPDLKLIRPNDNKP